jgi:hypothetical protein
VQAGNDDASSEYKSFKSSAPRKGLHHHPSMKEFRRLIKHTTLLTPEQIKQPETKQPWPGLLRLSFVKAVS